MAKNDNLTDFLKDVADAIRAKKGTSALINPQDFSSEIASIQSGVGGGSGSVSLKAVNFRDYDGTILHSYTKEEFLALSELPELPTQEGLTCQEWNWTLADAQEYVAEYGVIEIGATYITDDGKTRLYIEIATKGRMDVPLYFYQTITNGVTIDWGDGSATETLSGTGKVNTTHKYADIGKYVITLDVAEGCVLSLGHGSSSYCVMGSASNNGKVYCNMLRKVEIGDGVTSIDNYAFYNCYSLSSVIIPNSVTSIVNSAFSYCYSLSSAIIPNSVTSIVNSAFSYCYSLSSVIIPNSVTSIGNQTFQNCYGMAFYDFSQHTVVPTLSATNAFNKIPSDCKIIVPDALYDEWINATNWTTYANYIVKASEYEF